MKCIIFLFKYPPNSASDIWFKKTASDYFIYSEMVLVHLNLKERTFTFALFQELGSLCPLPQPPSLRIQYLTLLLTSTPRAYLFFVNSLICLFKMKHSMWLVWRSATIAKKSLPSSWFASILSPPVDFAFIFHDHLMAFLSPSVVL